MRNGLGWCDLGSKLLSVLVLGGVLVGGDLLANPTKSNEDCINCHDEVWRDIKSKMYVHRPDRDGDCNYCHLASGQVKGKESEAYLDKIKWVASGVNPVKEHWLEIDGHNKGATMLLEARSKARLKVKEFSLPGLDDLEELPPSSLVPPTISNVRLLGVSKGVFVSATIAWDTDTPSDSLVLYGVDKPDHTSMLDRQLVTNHVVVLTGVQPGKTYKYKVVSEDLAGNHVESAVKDVFVEVTGAEKLGSIGQPDSLDPDVKVSFYRHGNKSFVVVSSDQPVSIKLGIMPKRYADENPAGQPMVVRHPLLNTLAVTNIGICYSCHTEYKNTLNHPVDVYPKRGMIIPPEYVTLPDGRITCMSCHAAHASNVEFRLIKANKEELCRGCHQDIS